MQLFFGVTERGKSSFAMVKTEHTLTAECSRFSPGEKKIEARNVPVHNYQRRRRTWEGRASVRDGACEPVTIGCPVTTVLSTFCLDQGFLCGSDFVDIPGYETQEI